MAIAPLCALFFLSGAAGLIFETLWFHQAALAFGSSVAASSIVLASFMAGLAIGNGLAARHAERLRRPLLAYALLEAAIGALGLLLVIALPAAAPGIASLLRPWLDAPAALQAVRLISGFGMLLWPAAAMGATLPVLVLALRARDPSFGSALGRLYGWNTLGAVAGALAGELVLVALLGVRGTGVFAAACNGIAALGALWLGRGAVAQPRATARPRARLGLPAWRILLASALAGALLLALEVVWFRFLRLFVHSGSAAFAWMLAGVLAGIGVGGLLGGAWLRRRPEAWRAVPALALAAGAVTALLYASFGAALGPVQGIASSSPRFVAWLVAALAFPVALLSGLLFPLQGAALARGVQPESRAAGLLTLASTLGSASGSLIAGFALLPGLGIERSIFGLALGYAGVAALSGTRDDLRRALVPALALAVALAAFPFGRLQQRYLNVPIARWHGQHPHRVVAVREGRSETAVYVERRLDGERVATFLLTDGVSMSSTAVFARRYMKLFAIWPLALHPDPRDALLISYGVGSTAKALVDDPRLETIDVVDLSRDVLELSDLLYPDAQQHPLRDPRVTVHVEDGRHFLRLSEKRYDLITGEPPPPKNAGVVNLYTREYFELMHARLREGGIATYWLPVHNLLERDAAAIVRAFCDVFEDCSLWVGHDLDWMLAGTRELKGPRDEASFVRQWRNPRVAPELRRLGFERPEQLGATFLGDAAWLRERFGDTPPLTDDHPKRLSDALQTDARGSFGSWLDPQAARLRFRDSELVKRLWPAALRQRTLDYFSAEQRIEAVSRAAPLSFRERLEGVDALLDQGLGTAALWQLGVTHDQLAAVDAALQHGRPAAPHHRTLGIAALSSGDLARASREFALARTQPGADPFLPVLEAYARCRSGERLPTYTPADPAAQEAWRWLESRCRAPEMERL